MANLAGDRLGGRRMTAGMIEGFYGPLWSPQERRRVVAHLAADDYRFYHYAPKADAHLRENWREDWPEEQAKVLYELSADCRGRGMRFGIGLSPLGLDAEFGRQQRRELRRRLGDLDAVGIDDLVIQFDDVRGDAPDLAARQSEILDFAAGETRAGQIFFCPTWYSDDPLLDRLFGERPPDYLGELGRRLPQSVAVYWTGPEVCARTIPVDHVRQVAETLDRAPVLWDNYPVNDSPRMRRHLHLRPFHGRPTGLAEVCRAHAINPALQAELSCLPALTLTAAYRGENCEPDRAFDTAGRKLFGEALTRALAEHLHEFQDRGLDGLGEARRRELIRRFRQFDQPAAREVIRWLEEGYEQGTGAPGTSAG